MEALAQNTGKRSWTVPDFRVLWLVVLVFSCMVTIIGQGEDWLTDLPENLQLPIPELVNMSVGMFVDNTKWLFRTINIFFEIPMLVIQRTLDWLPWISVILLVGAIAWQGGGTATAMTALLCLLYAAVVGYWNEGLNTLTLVIVCIPIAVALGFSVGVVGYRYPGARKIIMVILDLAQTIPAFAYLIPILLLFGFGPVVGLIASVIFSTPPMVRNTMLGLEQVSTEVKESGTMSGCTPRQKFWWIEVPAGMPQMLVGVNQTTMTALSMVIIAAIIGGFDDIGWEVLQRLRKAQFGQSIMSGLVIVSLAILLDRITSAYARRQMPTASHAGLGLKSFLLVLVAIAAITIVAARFMPSLQEWPTGLIFYPAEIMNDGISWLVSNHGSTLDAIKNNALFFILLPVKIGLSKSISPFSWGFDLTPYHIGCYWTIVSALAVMRLYQGQWKQAVAIVVISGLLFYGTTGVSWMAVLAVVTLFAYQLGGRGVALFTASSLVYLLLTGFWQPAMQSIYLCTVAVTFCLLAGGLLGIWAASSETVSAIIRPVNDTLQTLPQFVLLIPALMFFQVGDFPALLAIIAYAIVPMIRYTEQGLRSVPRTSIEAGMACGCTPLQLFWQIRLKLALPSILVGVNQTILFSLNMLVIAALVGTTGLGQQIYLALSRANPGDGIVAGLGMALIAMSADRMMQAYIRKTSKQD